MPLSDKISILTQGYVDLLRSKWEDLGLTDPKDVYYGDQARYPRTPSLAVQAGNIRRDLNETAVQTLNELTMFIMVYHSPFSNPEKSQKEADEYAEKVEDIVHANRTLDKKLIHAHVSNHEPGAAERGGTLLRVTRLTITGLTKTRVGG